MQANAAPWSRSSSLVYWIGVVITPVLFLLAMRLFDRSPQIDPSWLHTKALLIVSDSEQPPDFASAAAVQTTFPDFTPINTVGEPASTWFQVSVHASSTPQGLWGVYFPSTVANFAVYANGAIVGASAPMTRPYAYFRTPLYFEFSSSLLRTGDNTIQIRAVSERFGVLMEPFYVGPAQNIKPAFSYADFLADSLMRATVVALGLISILMLGLFWVRPSDTANGWYAAANICWGLYNWLLIEPRVLIPIAGLWFALPPILIGWFTICAALFINRLPGGEPQPAAERSFLVFGVLGALAVGANRMLSPAFPWTQIYLWFPGVMLINVYIVWRLVRAARRNFTFEVRLWLLAAVLTLVIGLRDYMWDNSNLIGGSIHYLSYTVSVLLIVFGLTLLSRVTRALTEAETLNRELENRVAAKGQELARNYERLQSLERERAISAERERMTTDMHDGIGGQLIHALAVIESNVEFRPLEPILRGALDDLRLIIDSADPMEGDLLVVLSNFRARNERRVQQGGLRFIWQVTDLPPLKNFGPHKILQVLRVLQEALTNVLKHADATEVIVRTGILQNAESRTFISVDVIDDGRGYEPGVSLGRGLNNMRRRAQELGGSVELSSAPTGSRVRVILPVDSES